ncbi:hypothetical protein [Aquimonas sp.]|jgi:hypothetical protein|uniref:hypothetical protein n=1 Tax=Aquimonas sp. TaxID=1872588 RepID=UPI0037C0CD67
MNSERLQHLIDAYGADPARWPPAERAALAAARPLSAPLAQALAEAAALDQALSGLPLPELPSSLAARVLAAAPQAARHRPPAPQRSGWRELWDALGGLRLAGPAFALALSFGLGLGILIPQAAEESESDLDTYIALAWLDESIDEELP